MSLDVVSSGFVPENWLSRQEKSGTEDSVEYYVTQSMEISVIWWNDRLKVAIVSDVIAGLAYR